jgi:CHAT domain
MATILAVDAFEETDPATLAERMIIRIVRSPFNVGNVHASRMFSLTSGQLARWGSPNGVLERGIKLRDSLREHPGIAALLERIGETAKGQIQPLYVVLGESDAELISWETLCNSKDAFFALDPRWPIGRITDPITAQPRLPPTFESPVRVMAVISALGIHGQHKEWRLLRDAVMAARKGGLPIHLKLLVGAEELRAEIVQAIAEGAADIEVMHIDATAHRNLQRIIEFNPHILHFFCHGRSDLADQCLEIATAIDYLNPAAAHGSVNLTAADIGDLSTRLTNPWLLTLNCCCGGHSTTGLHSLAHQAVSGAFSAAVGMLESVDASDAYEFTRAFYPSLFASLRRVATALDGAPRAAFDWNEAMYDARAAIRDLHADPATSGEWALPALYIRGLEPFRFERASDDSEELRNRYKAKVEVVAKWLSDSVPNTNEAQRRDIMAQVLLDVPSRFWPSVDGEFDASRTLNNV